jgi:hypothetical protein
MNYKYFFSLFFDKNVAILSIYIFGRGLKRLVDFTEYLQDKYRAIYP